MISKKIPAKKNFSLKLENFTSHCLKNPKTLLVLLIGPLLIRTYCVYGSKKTNEYTVGYLVPSLKCTALASSVLHGHFGLVYLILSQVNKNGDGKTLLLRVIWLYRVSRIETWDSKWL